MRLRLETLLFGKCLTIFNITYGFKKIDIGLIMDDFITSSYAI